MKRIWPASARSPSLILAFALAVLSGCSHAPSPSSIDRPADTVGPPTAIEKKLANEVVHWLGTPYCRGGKTHNCADCSGFVQAVFANALGVHLPRTAAEMAKCGRPVPRSDLRPGDLVFFSIGQKTRHVAICLRKGEIVHSSSSEGISFSRLDDPYWSRNYLAARRIF